MEEVADIVWNEKNITWIKKRTTKQETTRNKDNKTIKEMDLPSYHRALLSRKWKKMVSPTHAEKASQWPVESWTEAFITVDEESQRGVGRTMGRGSQSVEWWKMPRKEAGQDHLSKVMTWRMPVLMSCAKTQGSIHREMVSICLWLIKKIPIREARSQKPLCDSVGKWNHLIIWATPECEHNYPHF